MNAFGRWTAPMFALVVVVTTATWADRAGALTLDSLASGGSFSAGALTFSNFEVTFGGSLSPDLTNYPVQVLSDGFRLGGPLSVLLGQVGTLLLSYDVSVSDPSGILGASLFADGLVIGAGSQAYVAESLFGVGNTPLGSLFVYSITGAGEQVSDTVALAGPTLVHVVKSVGLGSGTFAALPFVDQRFTAVPEPVSLLLMATGLLGLARAGQRQRVA